jgi:hypothetical protein
MADSAGRLLLESDVGVSDKERAQDGIHDGVEGAGGEGGDGEGDQADADKSKWAVSWITFAHGGAVGMGCMCRNCDAQKGARTSRKTSGSCPQKGESREWGQGRSLSG